MTKWFYTWRFSSVSTLKIVLYSCDGLEHDNPYDALGFLLNEITMLTALGT
jgi:hypothetical protein